jgi:hypothetical protein
VVPGRQKKSAENKPLFSATRDQPPKIAYFRRPPEQPPKIRVDFRWPPEQPPKKGLTFDGCRAVAENILFSAARSLATKLLISEKKIEKIAKITANSSTI